MRWAPAAAELVVVGPADVVRADGEERDALAELHGGRVGAAQEAPTVQGSVGASAARGIVEVLADLPIPASTPAASSP